MFVLSCKKRFGGGLALASTLGMLMGVVFGSGVPSRAQVTPSPPEPGSAQNPLARGLSDVLEVLEGESFLTVALRAREAGQGLGPKHRNVPPFLPYFIDYTGTFTPPRDGMRLALHADDGCAVWINGVKVHDHFRRGQDMATLSQSLHALPGTFNADQSVHVRIEYFNGWFLGPTDIDGATLYLYGGLDASGSDTGTSNEVFFGEWRAGEPIRSGGIRWPPAGATIQAGTVGHPSAFLATDFDQREVWWLEGGNLMTRTQVVSDPCSYTWTASGGAFLDPLSEAPSPVGRGQSVRWRAPLTPGTYTLTLVIDDQNQANQAPGEGGTRNDAGSGGFNDPPLTFTRTVQVVP